ncbi:unnamed protein product [Effrenium voratum]|nr:unnamed protein product [Effrenium voratum]
MLPVDALSLALMYAPMAMNGVEKRRGLRALPQLMAPRAAEVVPRQKTGEDSGCEATFFEAEEEASPPLELHELVALKVIQQGRLVLETQVDATTTVGHIKGQLELANGTPGDAQILTLHGLPLQNTQVLREQICQPATITMRKSDASWAAELEELLGAGDVASLFRARQSLGLLRDAAAQDAHALKEQALQLFADMTGKFKKATSMVLSSAAGLEAAASELRRNREVVFEVVPRSSKGSRRAAEDLMRCRSGLLSSANINGEMLMSCSRLLGPSHFELTAQLKELRGPTATAGALAPGTRAAAAAEAWPQPVPRCCPARAARIPRGLRGP